MQLTTLIDPPTEDCLDKTQALRFAPPAQFVEPQNEFRLMPELRNVAKLQDPISSLAHAAIALSGSQYLTTTTAQQKDVALGNALADLAVTGRVAYVKFQHSLPTQASIELRLRELKADPLMRPLPAELVNAISPALDRAFAVAWALRGPLAPQPTMRTPPAWFTKRTTTLGWIAVSGEDDTPHRPVNLAPPEFEQFEIPVSARGITIQTRFFIASAVEDSPPSGILPSARTLPPDPVPHIPDEHWVILFLHGHSSSAEEAGPIIPHIHKAGLDRGVKYSIVSLDLPNSGYSEMFDHTKVPGDTTFPSAPGSNELIRTPILEYMEDFVVAFVDALDQITPFKNRFAGIIGGSLGGNLGLILGRRPLAANPWLNAAIVSWSAASVWKPMIEDFFRGVGPGHAAGLWAEPETDPSRANYFKEAYERTLPFVNRKPPELWYRDDWVPCRTFHIADSRIARQEIYNANFRRWHWRLAGEQLIYSHVDRIVHGDNSTKFRFENNRVRQLLVAGERDNYFFSNIFNATKKLAAKMVDTPGLSLFLNDTGHSIHIERPQFFAGEIVNFFALPPLRRTNISFLVPLLLSDPVPPTLKRTSISFLTPLLLSAPG